MREITLFTYEGYKQKLWRYELNIQLAICVAR